MMVSHTLWRWFSLLIFFFLGGGLILIGGGGGGGEKIRSGHTSINHFPTHPTTHPLHLSNALAEKRRMNATKEGEGRDKGGGEGGREGRGVGERRR